MRFPFVALCAAILGLRMVAHAFSVHGVKHHHAHHVGAGASKTSSSAILSERDDAPGALAIELINNYDSDNLHVYIQTTLADSDQKRLITADGTPYEPVANTKYVSTPIPASANCGIKLGAKGSSVTITMPIPMLTGRIYVADGELSLSVLRSDSGISLQNPAFQEPYDPDFNTSFGFVEANQDGKCIYVNPTYVDFVGLPLGMELVTEKATLGISGLPGNGVNEVCRQLAAEQEHDRFPWGELCLEDGNGAPVRVLSPNHAPDGFNTYFDSYIDQVWQYITTNGIQFDTQDGNPLVSCQVQGEIMTCDRTSKPFPKPTSADIWGCNSGPFAQTPDTCWNKIGARFCAAFHRATFLLPGGDVQPRQEVSSYYPQDFPHNKYARIVHQVQVDHHGYAFPYDDVKPSIMVDGDEVSGSIASEGVSVLRVIVGGTEQADSAPASAPESLSAVAQSYSTGDASTQDPATTTSTPDSSTYATKTSDAPDTSTASTSAAPVSLESSTIPAPTTLITLASQTTEPAHPGDSPIAYSPLAGATTKHIAVVTVIETAVVTTYVTTTTTLLI